MTHSESRTNRRRFLEESMLAAAAMATAGTGELLWDEPAADRSALDQLGVAVIGVRGRGNTHLGFFAGRRDTRVLYVCDVDHQVGSSRIAQVVKRQGGNPPALVADMRRVLDDPRVDIVSIATPHHWHALAALWAMQAGKDVYLEKPVSHNVLEGRCLVQAAQTLRAHLPIGNAGAVESRCDRRHRVRAWRRDRSCLSRLRHLLQAALVDWTPRVLSGPAAHQL